MAAESAWMIFRREVCACALSVPRWRSERQARRAVGERAKEIGRGGRERERGGQGDGRRSERDRTGA
eukprot:3940566-Rhodomonas_salina.2